MARARPGRDHRRGHEHLVFDGSEHVPIATLPGMFDGPDALERGQVLLVHRLEGGLGDRAGRPGRRRARGQAVADVHVRLPAAAPPSRTPWTSRRTTRHGGRRPPGRKRDLPAVGWPASGSTYASRRAPTSRRPTSPALGWPDSTAFCLALPERAPASSPYHWRGSATPTRAGTWCAGPSARGLGHRGRTGPAGGRRPGLLLNQARTSGRTSSTIVTALATSVSTSRNAPATCRSATARRPSRRRSPARCAPTPRRGRPGCRAPRPRGTRARWRRSWRR